MTATTAHSMSDLHLKAQRAYDALIFAAYAVEEASMLPGTHLAGHTDEILRAAELLQLLAGLEAQS